MNNYQWLNHGHPQTLQTATLLLYFEGVLGLLGLGSIFGGILVCVGMIAGAFGIANDKKWGYGLALAAAVVNVALIFLIFGVVTALTSFGTLLPLMIGVALVALLLHPMSRSYQRIWFR